MPPPQSHPPTPSSDPDPQVITQRVTDPVEEPHTSELLPFSFQGGAPWSSGAMFAGLAMASWGSTLPLTGSFLSAGPNATLHSVRVFV